MKPFIIWVLTCFCLIAELQTYVRGQQLPCIPRDFGQDSFVCVCNATYCDTLPPPVIPPEGEYLVYSSDIAGKRFHRTQGSFIPGEGVGDANFTVGTRTFQTVLGWGGAFTDAAGEVILTLSPPAQDQLLRSYFSSSGIEYNIGRINMGGCDFSNRPYTYDDVDGDSDLIYFELQQEDLEYKIPLVHRAAAITQRPLKMFASPWSAPVWMKTNTNLTGYGQLLEEMYQPWANYFVKFLDGYKALNLTFWGLTAQNEPLDGYVPGFPFNCMGWTAEEQRRFVAENLGPTLENAGYGDIKLMILDDQRYNLPAWAVTVLNDSKAAQYIDGLAVHWYGDDYTSADRLTETHDLFPDYFLLATEACEGYNAWQKPVVLGSWARLESYVHDIILDMNNWMTGWVDWNIALDMEGGPNWAGNFVDSPIIINKDADEFYKNPMFYSMGHFSKFVLEGAVRLELISQGDGGLETVAFTNPDTTTAIVVFNRLPDAVELVLQAGNRGYLTFMVDPHSVHTIIFY